MKYHPGRTQKLLLCVIAAVPLLNRASASEPIDPTIGELLAAHNFIRNQRKLKPLTLSASLCKSAEVQARDMANCERMSHTGSDGSNPIQRARRVGYASNWVGENVAVSQWTVDQVMTEWMDSPGHRRNILGNYTEMGAGCVQDPLGNLFWCVNFGAPRPPTRTAASKHKPIPADSTKAINADAARALVYQINRNRKAAGQVPLEVDLALGTIAMKSSAFMAANDGLSAVGGPLEHFNDKERQAGELHVEVGSDIPSPQEAARQFAEGCGQEFASFRSVGAGYALSETGRSHWCVLFAKETHDRSRGGLDR